MGSVPDATTLLHAVVNEQAEKPFIMESGDSHCGLIVVLATENNAGTHHDCTVLTMKRGGEVRKTGNKEGTRSRSGRRGGAS